MTELRKVRIDGVDYTPGQSGVDPSTEALSVIEYEHHRIHEGSFYRACFQKDVPNGGTAILALTTVDTTKWVHLMRLVSSELESEVVLYENPTSITGGAPLTPLNVNRNSVNTSDSIIVSDPTVNLVGAIEICRAVIGSGRSIGGSHVPKDEWVLKQNTIYLIIVTNQAVGAANETNIHLTWYEHINKN